jgi:hypothetical protein
VLVIDEEFPDAPESPAAEARFEKLKVAGDLGALQGPGSLTLLSDARADGSLACEGEESILSCLDKGAPKGVGALGAISRPSDAGVVHGTENRVGCEASLRMEVEISQGEGFASGLRVRVARKGMKRDPQDHATHKEQPAQAAQALHRTSLTA